MNLKTFAAAFAAIVFAFSASSCQKDATERFSGNYSFKTSGYLTARDTSATPDTIMVAVSNESGQMDIARAGEGRLVVTMNVTGGDMLVFYAETDGEDIVLTPSFRKMKFGTTGSLLQTSYDAAFSIGGRGTRYGNIIIFDLDYSGNFSSADNSYDVIGSSVVCRAKLNE